MIHISSLDNQIESLELPIERDQFLRTMIRELAGTLQEFMCISYGLGLGLF